MKVTLINTADAGGGAPQACMRLFKALKLNQVDMQFLVEDQQTTEPGVISIATNAIARLRIKFNFLYERLPFIWFKAKDDTVRFAFSTADAGTDISQHPAVQQADLIHLHWTNSGFLSVKNIEQLLATGKPVVWTLHDLWAFTGGCHYPAGCDHFLNQCGNCWMLRDADENDTSHKGWQRKAAMLKAAKNLTIITCSNWLADVARTSSLLKGLPIAAIPNPIDTTLFSARDQNAARAKWNISESAQIILFGAANIMDRRKGIGYLVAALNELKAGYSDLNDVQIVIFGKNKAFDLGVLPFKVYEAGIISSEDELAGLYSLADVYVSPAIEDNLPNTIMEALSCGTPVVAFNTGGIPDLVEHKHNGYLAEFKSATDLAAGLHFALTDPSKSGLSANARRKVMDTFTSEIVAKKYRAVYRSILK